MNSFKSEAMIAQDLNSIAAFMPPLGKGNWFENYINIITNSSLMRYMANTLVYATILIVCSIVVNGLAGYALAKINDCTYGNNYYNTLYNDSKSRIIKYSNRIYITYDSESV